MRCTVVALALFGFAAVAMAAPISDGFDAFIEQEHASFKNSADELIHEALFDHALKKIESHNSQSGASFIEGINENSDLSLSELKKERLGFNASLLDDASTPAPAARQALIGGVAIIDWRSKMTPVKNQGRCGSCWAFSALAVLESRLIIKGQLDTKGDLSEQNLVDCAKTYGNLGCNGGVPGWAFNYIKDRKGVNPEASYPYKEAENTAGCLAPSTGLKSVLFGTVAYKSVIRGSDADMMAALKSGPVCACIGVNANPDFYYYKSGLFNCPNVVTQSTIDHAIVVCGATAKSWIIRNSWGTTWGMQGYAEVARIGDPCGILIQAQYPVLA